MLRPNRSWLFIPGGSEKMLGKAPGIAADAIILDLEDAVAPDQKETARGLVQQAILAGNISGQVYVRVNTLEGGLGEADVASVTRPGLTGILLSKTETAAQLDALDASLRAAEVSNGMAPGTVTVVALVETPLGVLNALEIARGARITTVCLGGEDYSLSLGARRTTEGAELDFARAMVTTAAAAAEVQPVDTVWTDVRNAEGLGVECRRMRDLGFTGKLAIHPGQLPVIHEAFSPTPKEGERARRIVEAFEASPSGVVAFEGKMVDAPVVERARRVLAMLEAFPPARPNFQP